MFFFHQKKRWGTSSSQNETSTYKRRIGLNTNGVTDSNNKLNGSSSLPSNTNSLNTSNSNDTIIKAPSPTPNPKDPLGHLKIKLIEADSNNRR